LFAAGADFDGVGARLVRDFCGAVRNAMEGCVRTSRRLANGAGLFGLGRLAVGHNVARFCVDAQFGR